MKMKIRRKTVHTQPSIAEDDANRIAAGDGQEEAEQRADEGDGTEGLPNIPAPAESEPKRKTYDFRSMNRAMKAKQIPEYLVRIITTALVKLEDIEPITERIESSLKVGVKRSEHGFLHKACDLANQNAHDGARLLITVEHLRKVWESENAPVFAKMWSDAIEQLEIAGVKKGTATNKAIEMKIALLWPEDWIAQELDRDRFKRLVEFYESLSKQAADRVATIRAMLTTLRSNG